MGETIGLSIGGLNIFHPEFGGGGTGGFFHQPYATKRKTPAGIVGVEDKGVAIIFEIHPVIGVIWIEGGQGSAVDMDLGLLDGNGFVGDGTDEAEAAVEIILVDAEDTVDGFGGWGDCFHGDYL